MSKRTKKRERGTIDTLPSGSLRVRIYAGVDPITKKRYDLTETIPHDHPDRDNEAERALNRLRSRIDQRRHPRTRATVEDLLERYMASKDIERSTRSRDWSSIRTHILPLLGSEPIAKIDSEVVDSWIAELKRCRAHCVGVTSKIDHRTKRKHECDERCVPHMCKGLGRASIRKAYWIMHGAFERARKTYKWTDHNPVDDVSPPGQQASQPSPPSAAEAAAIVKAAWAKADEWGMLVWLAMTTGMRRGELSALRWRHLMLDNGVIRFDRAIGVDGAEIYEKGTKTHQQRSVVLDRTTCALLGAYKMGRQADADRLGFKLSNGGFVFSLEPDHSRPLRPPTITQKYKRMVTKLEIDTTLNRLRHYSATELIAAGVDVRTVAGRLGHGGGGTTTLRTYAAFVSEADQRAAQALLDRMPAPPVAVDPNSGQIDSIEAKPAHHTGPYDQIAADLRAAIRCGALQPGEYLPSMKTLAQRYDVVPSTVHRAIATLKTEGIVTASRGRRATVATPPDRPGTSGLAS